MSAPLDARQLQKIDEICCQVEEIWQQGGRPKLASFLKGVPATLRAPLFEELIGIELEQRRQRGEAPTLAEYLREFPEFQQVLRTLFASESRERMNCPKCKADNPAGAERCVQCKSPLATPSYATGTRCLECGADMPAKAMFCGKCGKSLKRPEPPPPPPVVPAPEPVVEAAPEPAQPEVAAVKVETPQERRETKAELITPANSLRPMVLVPAGEFLMGSPEGVGNPDEQPPHKVKLSAYYIDRHAVTNLEYERFDPAHKRLRPEVSDGDNDPVVMVAYEDCLRYCRWRAEQEKIALDSYSLPTEAQWERAARGGLPTRIYAWGLVIDPDFCNTLETGRGRAVAVDTGSPNGFHLFHMGSNVREWCLDRYSQTYYSLKISLWQDPQGPPANPVERFRVVRGASFIEPGAAHGRCAARGFAAPKSAQTDIGFRCVRQVGLR
jgi:formylglycine-generating enzyme required for sulfatase activity/ribosomal protein L40E